MTDTIKLPRMSDDKVVPHPRRLAMLDAARERAVVDSTEGQALQAAIFKAVNAYVSFLDRHGLFWQDDPNDPDALPIMKAQELVVTADPLFGSEISLKDGPIDRIYGNGVDPDPEGRNPT